MGSLAEIAAETPASAETPPARELPGTPSSGPRGQGRGAPAHPSLSGSECSLAAAASATQAGTERVRGWRGQGCPGPDPGALPNARWPPSGVTQPAPASPLQAPVGRRPCSGWRPEPGPASAQSWRRRGLSEGLQLAARLRAPTEARAQGALAWPSPSVALPSSGLALRQEARPRESRV